MFAVRSAIGIFFYASLARSVFALVLSCACCAGGSLALSSISWSGVSTGVARPHLPNMFTFVLVIGDSKTHLPPRSVLRRSL